MTKHKYTFIEGEVWKDIPDYEGYYQVSDMGRVRSCDRTIKHSMGGPARLKGCILNPSVNRQYEGYHYVTLRKDGERVTRKVHILVMLAFAGPRPEGLVINHINGNSADHRWENLEYCTRSENTQHAYRIGLIDKASLIGLQKGEKNGRAIISEVEAVDIHRRLRNGERSVDIATLHNTSVYVVADIKRGQSWAYLKEA